MVLLDFTLLGLSSLSGVKFSVISFACVIMSVGLSADYLLHVASETEREGEKEGIRNMGGSVFKGAGTTLLGVLMLSMTR